MDIKSLVKIPNAWVIEFDDVGWDDGRDLRLWKKASRSGLPRYHALEDYQLLHEIGKAAGMTVNVALCLGDWDKDNFLRGEVGITHNPYEWDRASEIDVEKFSKYRDVMENSPYVDYSVHGLLHGSYDAEGNLIHEKEYFDKIERDGKPYLVLRSEEDFNRRLDIFFKIYDSWGFKKPIKVFISPCGLGFATHEELSRIAGELYKRGIRYWTNGGFYFEESMKVINGVACVKKTHPVRDGVHSLPPWDAYDVDPTNFGDYDETNNDGCVYGMHWTNLVRFDPVRDFEQVELWANYIKRQSEIFGLVNAQNIVESINQHFYYRMAKMTVDENVITIDLSEVMKNKLDCHNNVMMISFKKEIAPKSCEGGEIELYQEKADFVTYKIKHNADVVKITV